MTSHARRLQMYNHLAEPYNNHPQSIISGGYSSSISSQDSVPRYSTPAKQQPAIPEHIEMSYVPTDREPMFEKKTAVKFSSGPCSSIISNKTSTLAPSIGSRLSITSEGKIKRLSQSLGGSKASLATEKSHKSTIQQEYHDIKITRRLNALSYGKASRPFLYSMICFSVGFVMLFVGVTVIMMRLYGQLFLSMDKGDVIGPIFIVGSLVLLGVGIKFIVDAYRIGAAERRRLGFRACGRNMVVLKVANNTPAESTKPRDVLQSGTSTNQAIRKVLGAETRGNSQLGSTIL